MNNKTIIVIPTFNESKSIEKIIEKINTENLPVDIVVVDDNSPDGTSDIVASMQDVYPNLFLITKTTDTGFARAYISGFKYALDKGYEKVIQMDADGSHQPKFLKSLLAASEKYDYVIGSRWTKGGSVVNWPFKRLVISRVGNLYSRIMLGSSIKDVTGGFKVINAAMLKKMKTEDMTSRGYSFQIELYLRAKENGASFKEVPIEFIEREEGVSKMSKAIVKEAMVFVTKKGLHIV
jgi:dolichol-phosphate mannosyltransferase